MRQYRITTQNIDIPQDNDCVLPENDPAHEIRRKQFLGGLGASPNFSQSTQDLIKRFWKDNGDCSSEAEHGSVEPVDEISKFSSRPKDL